MKDLFYVVEVKDQWYNLCVKDTHYCLSCGSDLSTLMTVVYNCVRKYKTEDRLLGALSLLSDLGKVSPATFERRQANYDLGKHSVFNSMVIDTVKRAVRDSIQDSPYNRVKNRVKVSVLSDSTREEVISPSSHEKLNKVGVISPLKVRRIRPLGN